MYATVQGLKSDAEDLKTNIKRLCSHLHKDVIYFAQEVYGDLEEDPGNSVIKDLLDQLTELGKRYLNIKVMLDTEPEIEAISLRDVDWTLQMEPTNCTI